MNHRTFLGSSAVLIAAAWMTVGAGTLAAQTPVTAKAGAKSNAGSDAPFASKTPWGDPDLQGTWTSDDTWGVPFERPKNFGTRATLTEDEVCLIVRLRGTDWLNHHYPRNILTHDFRAA